MVFNNGNAVINQRFRGDKISPREQLEIVRDLLDTLKLPDIIPTRLDVARVQVRRSELVKNIEIMLRTPAEFDKYTKLL